MNARIQNIAPLSDNFRAPSQTAGTRGTARLHCESPEVVHIRRPSPFPSERGDA